MFSENSHTVISKAIIKKEKSKLKEFCPRQNHFKNLGLLTLLILGLNACSSGNNPKKPLVIQSFYDDFDQIESIWSKKETTDQSRYEIIKDPVDSTNNVIKFDLYPEDFVRSGKRNEFKFAKTKEKNGSVSEFSFKFYVPEDFFKKRDKEDWLMLHQWHDEPPKGQGWSDYNMGTHPPSNLFINMQPNGDNYIVYAYGLWNKDFNHTQYYQFPEKLESDTWYTFKNTIKWSLDDGGYSIPILNGKKMVNAKENEEGKTIGANIYNTQANYFKFGVYGNKKANDTISILFDDFRYGLSVPPSEI